jgi:hypothetical protein
MIAWVVVLLAVFSHVSATPTTDAAAVHPPPLPPSLDAALPPGLAAALPGPPGPPGLAAAALPPGTPARDRRCK